MWAIDQISSILIKKLKRYLRLGRGLNWWKVKSVYIALETLHFWCSFSCCFWLYTCLFFDKLNNELHFTNVCKGFKATLFHTFGSTEQREYLQVQKQK